MNRHKAEILISILMESPMYLTIPIKARRSLVISLLDSYPFLFDPWDCDKEVEFRYEFEQANPH
jgi:hypothetical protein